MQTIELIEDNTGELTHQALDEGARSVMLELGKSYEALQRENARLKAALEEVIPRCEFTVDRENDKQCGELAAWFGSFNVTYCDKHHSESNHLSPRWDAAIRAMSVDGK